MLRERRTFCPTCGNLTVKVSNYFYKCGKCSKSFYVYPEDKIKKVESKYGYALNPELTNMTEDYKKSCLYYIKRSLTREISEHLLENNYITVKKIKNVSLGTTEITESINIILPEIEEK